MTQASIRKARKKRLQEQMRLEREAREQRNLKACIAATLHHAHARATISRIEERDTLRVLKAF